MIEGAILYREDLLLLCSLVPAGFVPTAVPVIPSPRSFPHLPWERLGRKGCESHVSVLARGKDGQWHLYRGAERVLP